MSASPRRSGPGAGCRPRPTPRCTCRPPSPRRRRARRATSRGTRDRSGNSCRQPVAIEGPQVQQLEVEKRQAPGGRRAAAAAVRGDHIELAALEDARHVGVGRVAEQAQHRALGERLDRRRPGAACRACPRPGRRAARRPSRLARRRGRCRRAGGPAGGWSRRSWCRPSPSARASRRSAAGRSRRTSASSREQAAYDGLACAERLGGEAPGAAAEAPRTEHGPARVPASSGETACAAPRRVDTTCASSGSGADCWSSTARRRSRGSASSCSLAPRTASASSRRGSSAPRHRTPSACQSKPMTRHECSARSAPAHRSRRGSGGRSSSAVRSASPARDVGSRPTGYAHSSPTSVGRGAEIAALVSHQARARWLGFRRYPNGVKSSQRSSGTGPRGRAHPSGTRASCRRRPSRSGSPGVIDLQVHRARTRAAERRVGPFARHRPAAPDVARSQAEIRGGVGATRRRPPRGAPVGERGYARASARRRRRRWQRRATAETAGAGGAALTGRGQGRSGRGPPATRVDGIQRGTTPRTLAGSQGPQHPVNAGIQCRINRRPALSGSCPQRDTADLELALHVLWRSIRVLGGRAGAARGARRGPRAARVPAAAASCAVAH